MTAPTHPLTHRRPSRPIVARLVERLNRLIAIPYLVIALGLRLLMARVFFLDGQPKIEGPALPLNWLRLDLSLTLPIDINDTALQAMQTQYARLPLLSPTKAAYLFTYAEFVLPICLVIGFATRFAAFA